MSTFKKYSYAVILLLLVVIISFGISFSRYSSTLSNTGDLSTVITIKDYNLEVIWDEPPTQLQFPGIVNDSYNFTLRNTEETDLLYNLTIAMSWDEATPVIGLNVPLIMHLYIVNTDNSLTPVTTTVSRTTLVGAQVNSLHTQPAVIPGNQDIHFRMHWSWGTEAADRNYNFANKDINIKIDVNAQQ